ncbi:hypothetical protein FZI85_27820 [Mycobacterium sp. CBMA293]|uniref:Uncharacterized protein n=1 Tax=Mycolicibacterium sp. CBMA 213 TaxID=1968788 RepID=A0A1S6GKY4_9MYCO|nr:MULTISPECIES: hypothetical protein [unclassified Mycolicibacterium]AQS22502.1 hypothetical protein pCBMA213_2_00138 [Mycolicibacterium sp. CBMA 213]MUL48402.1 hypothetical protein [Mycolicibacterium sp. CBMA 360]MUL62414.1 hypothetical protein [Mycolicibacterium sp. CBMA 335]MUM04551.1 hypothetical protein [Mycolicibacterium sp. CBMA 213]MUM14814.1 hypothetical protein [Mycolicibacterium sp. CBMA 293]
MSQRRTRDAHLLQITGLELAYIVGLLLLVAATFGSIAVAYEVTSANDSVTVTSSVTQGTPSPPTK